MAPCPPSCSPRATRTRPPKFAPSLAPNGWSPIFPRLPTGPTFAENSALKALAASARAPGAWVAADDSGLEVDALGGAPGVQSARYSGPEATDAANRAKLTQELAGVAGAAPRTARFHCV